MRILSRATIFSSDEFMNLDDDDDDNDGGGGGGGFLDNCDESFAAGFLSSSSPFVSV